MTYWQHVLSDRLQMTEMQTDENTGAQEPTGDNMNDGVCPKFILQISITIPATVFAVKDHVLYTFVHKLEDAKVRKLVSCRITKKPKRITN